MQSDVDVKIEEVQAGVPVRSLTHCNDAGEIYQRAASIQSQIEAALTLTSSQLIERAQISDDKSSEYFQEECLVYLIREFHRGGDYPVVDNLAKILIQRCKSMIYGGLRTLGLDTVDDAFSDVILDVFTDILDLESDRGDFLQVRFGVVLKRRIIGVYNRQVKRIKEVKDSISLSSVAGYDAEGIDDVRISTSSEDVADLSISMEQRLLYQEGLSTLKDPYRTAFILRYYEGWQIDSKDSSVPTLSRFFNKTPRTIHAWLAHAEDMLECWRGERHEPEQ